MVNYLMVINPGCVLASNSAAVDDRCAPDNSREYTEPRRRLTDRQAEVRA